MIEWLDSWSEQGVGANVGVRASMGVDGGVLIPTRIGVAAVSETVALVLYELV